MCEDKVINFKPTNSCKSIAEFTVALYHCLGFLVFVFLFFYHREF